MADSAFNEEKLQQQKEALGQMKMSKKPMPNEDSKENLFPLNELDDIELTIVKRLKNEENTNDSLKSLDGSAIDYEEGDKHQNVDDKHQMVETQSEELPNQENNSESDNETTGADDELSVKNSSDIDEIQNSNEKSADAISTSDIIADMSQHETVEQIISSTPKDELTDEQKVLQTQANYGLASNYKKETPEPQESDSDTELFQKPNCKCETIRHNPHAKTKVCNIL